MFRIRQHSIVLPFLVVIIAICSVVSSLHAIDDNGKPLAYTQGLAYTRTRFFADEVQPMLLRKKRQTPPSDPESEELIGQLLPCFTSKPVDFSKCFDQSSPEAIAQIRKLVDFAQNGAQQVAKMTQHESEQLKKLAKVVSTISQAVMRIKGVKNKTPEQIEGEQIEKTPTGGDGAGGKHDDDEGDLAGSRSLESADYFGINNRNEDGDEQVSDRSGRARRRFGVGSEKQLRRRWAIEKYQSG